MRTDMMKLLVAFRNFANAPKKLAKLLALYGKFSVCLAPKPVLKNICRHSVGVRVIGV